MMIFTKTFKNMINVRPTSNVPQDNFFPNDEKEL